MANVNEDRWLWEIIDTEDIIPLVDDIESAIAVANVILLLWPKDSDG